MAITGMDPDAVDELAVQIDRCALELERLVGAIDALTQHAFSIWQGNSVHLFHAEWSGVMRQRALSVLGTVTDLAATARRDAGEQRVASDGASGGGSASGFVTGPGSPASGVLAGAGAVLSLVSTIQGARAWKRQTDASLEWRKGWSARNQGTGQILGLDARGQSSVTAAASVNASAHGLVNLRGANASASTSAAVGVAAAASAAIGKGPLKGSVTASAQAGASATAAVSAKVGVTGASAQGHLGAQAGAQVDAAADADVAGVHGAATVHGYAGAGIHADGTVSMTMNEVKVGLDVGAALGLGAGVGISVAVTPQEVVHNVTQYLPRPKWSL